MSLLVQIGLSLLVAFTIKTSFGYISVILPTKKDTNLYLSMRD
jgi:hypothetical protein